MNTYSTSIVRKPNPAISVGNSATASQISSSTGGGIAVEIVPPSDWDELATQFSDINPEQTGQFNIGHWGADKIECFAVRRFGLLIGGGSVIVRSLPFTSAGIAVVKWGPVWRRADDNSLEEDQKDNYKAAITGLIAEYCEKRRLHLTIMPPAVPEYGQHMSETLIDLGFAKGAYLAAPKRYIVNTHQSTDSLMAGFEQKYRYNLRSALKNHFAIELCKSEEGLDSFMDLYRRMVDRKRFLDASAIGSLEAFVKDSPDNTRPHIVLVSHEGKVTAGGVIFTAGDMASYMFGATDDRALRLKAGYALHWWICQYLCSEDRVKWYDLGGNDLDAGLHQFKKGMVGKTGMILDAPPRYHFASGHVVKLLGDTVYSLRDAKASVERAKHRLTTWLRK